MKRKWKTNGLKRSIAVLMAAALAFTMQGSMGFSAEAEGTATTETMAVEEVLFESNYDGVTHYDNCPDGAKENNTDWYRILAGQLFTQKIDGNGYLEYTQSSNTLGVIRLGHTYEQKNMTYTPITVTAGKTYMIEFDMRVNAAQWVVKNNETSTAKWPAQDLLMGVAVGPATTSLDIAYTDYRDSNTANLKVFETLAANTKVVSSDWEGNVDGWVHRKWVYTVPEDCNLSANNALQLFFAAGQRCAVSIDNVKVSTNELITSSKLSYNDYSTAVLSSEGTRDEYNFTRSSLSALPDVDPLDSNNKTIGYKQWVYDKGAVYLGAKYAAGQETAIEDAIKAEAGATYLVQYDYYTEGKVNSTAGLKMYLTVGKTVLDQEQYSKNSISYEADAAQLLLNYAQNTDLAMSDWKRNNIAIITIPEDATFENGQYLMFYVTGGGQGTDRAHIYFDNIKVSKVTKTEVIETEDKVLFESNYDGVTHYDNCPDGAKVNNTDWYRILAGQLFTQKIDGNGYLEYTQGDNTLGVIRLGHTYEQKSMTYTPITVTAGKTYVIEFDMRVNAAQWVVKNNETGSAIWPAGSDLLMGVAVGPATTSLNIAYAAYRDSNTADLKVFESLAQSSKVVSTDWEGNKDGWVHREWIYTVPEDCNLSTNNALQLFFAGGQRCAVSIDNIKVIEQCAGVNVFYSVDNKTTNTYNSDGKIPYNAMLDSAENTAMRWYTDAAHTKAFISGDYERQSKLTTQNLYGVKDLSTIAFVKGDASGDGVVDADDLSTLRNGLLGDAITYATRAECNEDGSFNIKDLVRAARIAKDDTSLQSGLKIGSQELSSYKVVEQGIDGTNEVLTSKVVELREFAYGETNTINVKLDTTLANNSYVVKVEGNSLDIVGQNADALITAIETVLGYVRAGVSMTTQHSTEFVYTGGAYPAAQNLVFSENF